MVFLCLRVLAFLEAGVGGLDKAKYPAPIRCLESWHMHIHTHPPTYAPLRALCHEDLMLLGTLLACGLAFCRCPGPCEKVQCGEKPLCRPFRPVLSH